MHHEFTLTDVALAKAQHLQNQIEGNKDLPLRLYIEGKGCDGFYYGVSFDEKEKGDIEFDFKGLRCIIDERAHIFCKGSQIEWIDDERGQGFLVENPREKSFRGKFYKKSSWRSRLEGLAKAQSPES
jgi:iron-sulfur cluster assembly accessory protein